MSDGGFVVIIPSRYQAVRLPGKPLAKIGGIPLIVRVYQQAIQSDARAVYVATDDIRIADTVRAIGAAVVMTDSQITSGTDRIAAAADALAIDDGTVVVNVQGDEPFIAPSAINAVAMQLGDSPMATLATCLDSDAPRGGNVVTVVCDRYGQALYFSRAPIPYVRGEPTVTLRHVGIYSYRADFLRHFARLAPSPLERTEQLEQLRALWHGYAINVGIAEGIVDIAVDTPADIARAEAYLNAH